MSPVVDHSRDSPLKVFGDPKPFAGEASAVRSPLLRTPNKGGPPTLATPKVVNIFNIYIYEFGFYLYITIYIYIHYIYILLLIYIYILSSVVDKFKVNPQGCVTINFIMYFYKFTMYIFSHCNRVNVL